MTIEEANDILTRNSQIIGELRASRGALLTRAAEVIEAQLKVNDNLKTEIFILRAEFVRIQEQAVLLDEKTKKLETLSRNIKVFQDKRDDAQCLPVHNFD